VSERVAFTATGGWTDGKLLLLLLLLLLLAAAAAAVVKQRCHDCRRAFLSDVNDERGWCCVLVRKQKKVRIRQRDDFRAGGLHPIRVGDADGTSE
jgi:hypothetical protein